MKCSKGGVILTRHSKRRANQRVGITKNQMSTIVGRAFTDGISHIEASNDLENWMNAEYLKHKTANNCKYYANHLYIFHNRTLITVINAPTNFEHDLFNNVRSIKIYLRYKKDRYKYKSNSSDILKSAFTEEIQNQILEGVNNYIDSLQFDDTTIPYEADSVCPSGFSVNIIFFNKKVNDIYKNKINEFIYNNYGLQTRYVRKYKE